MESKKDAHKKILNYVMNVRLEDSCPTDGEDGLLIGELLVGI